MTENLTLNKKEGIREKKKKPWKELLISENPLLSWDVCNLQ